MTTVEIKKAKDAKKCVITRKIKFQDYKNCLEANQLENETNYLEKNDTEEESLKKEFTKNNKSLLKTTKI